MAKPLRVLMVEDSQDDALLLIRALEKGGYDPLYERVEEAEAMRKALAKAPWDVILCDYQLPQFDGPAAIALWKKTGSAIPLIIVSGAIGEETAADCMRYGAHDCVMKDNLARLVPAIERELEGAESRAQKGRLEKSLQATEKVQASIAEIGRIINSSLKVNEVYDRLAEAVRKLIPFDRLIVSLIDLRSGNRRFAYIAGMATEGRKQGKSLPLEGSFTGEVLRTRTGFVFNATSLEALAGRFPPAVDGYKAGLRSLLSVPLISKGEVIGSLTFRSKTPHAYTEQVLPLAQQIGDQIAGAIANAQLYADLEKEEREKTIIGEIGRIISSRLEIGEVYEQFAGEAGKLISFHRMGITLNHPSSGTVEVAHVSGEPFFGRKVGDSFPLKGSINELLIRAGKGFLVNPERADELAGGYPDLVENFRQGMRSMMSVPLMDRNEVIGALNFRSKVPGAYGESDFKIAQRIGDQIAGAIANAQIYAELKGTEARLREDEARFRAMFEHSAVGKTLATPDKIIVQVNKTFADMLGYRIEELEKVTFTQIIHPDDLAATRETVRLLLAGNQESSRFERRYIHKSGATVWGDVSTTLLFDDQGRPRYFLATVVDISDRKRAEEALKASEESFRRSLDESPLGIRIHSDEGEVLYSNKTMLDLFGYDSIEDWQKIPPAQRYTEASRAVVRALRMRRLKGDKCPYEVELDIIRKDGEVRHVHQWRKRVHWFGKDQFQVIFQDITDHKRAEEELLKSMERLRRSLAGTVSAISMAVEVKDPYTSGHQKRTSNLARAIATEMGLPTDRSDFVRTAASIHDIGKIAIPSEILSRPTKLRAVEFSLIKAHPQAGYDILKDIAFPWPVADAILQHHERMDGSGYPNGLKGEEILLEARIMAVADVVEAMASHRPYRPTLGIEAALAEIENHRGSLYDDVVAKACLRLFREKGFELPAV